MPNNPSRSVKFKISPAPIGAGALSGAILGCVLYMQTSLGMGELQLIALIWLVTGWFVGEIIGCVIPKHRWNIKLHPIIIESFSLLASFFATSSLSISLIGILLGLSCALRFKNSILESRISSISLIMALVITVQLHFYLQIILIVLLGILTWRFPSVSETKPIGNQTQIEDVICSTTAGFLTGVIWLILGSTFGLTIQDDLFFLFGLSSILLFIPKVPTRTWSIILICSPLFLCLYGLGFTHSLFDSLLGERPWAPLRYIPVLIGVFLAMVGSFTVYFNAWTLRTFVLGIVFSVFATSSWNPIWVVVGLMFLGVIFTINKYRRLLFFGIGGFAVFFSLTEKQPRGSMTWMSPHHIPNLNQDQALSQHHWSVWGHHQLTTTQGVSFFVNETEVVTGWSNGFRISTVGRGASSEYFVGQLFSTWPENVAQATILGDFSTNILSGYSGSPLLIHYHTPDPWLTRWFSDFSESRQQKLLQPNIVLHNDTRLNILRSNPPQDLIIEAIHTPFDTIVQGRPNQRYFSNRIDALSENGFAVFIFHTPHWPPGSPQTTIAAAIDAAPYAQLWLPPNGVDSLILVLGRKPFNFDEALSSMTNKSTLQFFESSPVSTLSRAIAGKEELEEWTSNAVDQIYHPHQFTSLPLLHLSTFDPDLIKAKRIWQNIPGDALPTLEKELVGKQKFLTILNQASQGNIQDVFLQASELLEQGFANNDTLNTLIEPHLADARKFIRIARKEGQTSKAWTEASRFATTANMLSPNSPEPLCLLGEIAIGEGHVDKAEKYFESALEIDPVSLPALDGMARTSGLNQDDKGVEEWLILALKSHPNVWTTHYNLGTFLRLQEQFDESEARLRKAISLSQTPNPLPHLQLAELYLSMKQATRALLEAERAVQIDPSAQAWYLRGRAYFDLGQWGKAEDDFRRATLTDANLHAARGAVGLVQIQREDYLGAAQTFRAVLRFDPNNTAARENLRLVEIEIASQTPTPANP